MGEIQQFWFDVRSHWDPDNDQVLREVTRSVLRHLRMELPVSETAHLFDTLPRELDDMTRDVVAIGRRARHQPGEHDSEPAFYEHIADETELSQEQVAEAAHAVFAALKHHLPAEEVNHVHAMLPAGLKRQWELAW